MQNIAPTNVLGLGNDIIEIDRLRQSIRRSKNLLDRLFTKNEQSYCAKYKDPSPHYAGRFAAKEAVAKALGTGFGKNLSFLDIEIINKTTGQPTVILSPTATKLFTQGELLITISHCKLFATATALLIRTKM